MSFQMKINKQLLDYYEAREKVEAAQLEAAEIKKNLHKLLVAGDGSHSKLRFYDYQLGDQLARIDEDYSDFAPLGDWVRFMQFDKPNDLTEDLEMRKKGVI